MDKEVVAVAPARARLARPAQVAERGIVIASTVRGARRAVPRRVAQRDAPACPSPERGKRTLLQFPRPGQCQPSRPPPSISRRALPRVREHAPAIAEWALHHHHPRQPHSALSKGWSFLSAAVVGASKVVNESVIQPGMEKVSDPELQRNVKGYLEGAKKGAVSVGSSANAWGKTSLGSMSRGVSVRSWGKLGGGPSREGYGAVPTGWEGERGALYAEEDDDFFEHTTKARRLRQRRQAMAGMTTGRIFRLQLFIQIIIYVVIPRIHPRIHHEPYHPA